MLEIALPEHLPELKQGRVVRSMAEVHGDRPEGQSRTEFELTFDVVGTQNDVNLRATAKYEIAGVERDGETPPYFHAELTHEFTFGGPLVGIPAVRSALILVWPYVRQSVQTLAQNHSVPLRGVPMILAAASMPDEGFEGAFDDEDPPSGD